MKISVAGFQSPNGNSTLYTAETINTFHFGRSLLQIRIQNTENCEIANELLEILNSEAFEDENIKNLIPIKNSEEFKQDILRNISDTNASKELTVKRIKKTINLENTEDKRKISIIKAQNFTLTLLNYFNIDIQADLIKKPLKLKKLFDNKNEVDKLFPNSLKSEKRIVIIIDNFSVHKTYLSRIICKILNIKLIYLPKYSPFLNPIEQLWRTMKNILHRNPIPDIEYLKKEVVKLYYELVDEISFVENWI
ncbi:transposase, partial [Methanobrevibacter filiformis]|uniref:transposase n=1 Tax=Methanobrevibacter filiformis TaxID=55758 RepID=UPI000834FC0A